MRAIQELITEQWYQPKPWGKLLTPVSKIFELIVFIRKYCYAKGIFTSFKADVPVIIVGNITVGGTGKTPLVIALASILQKMNLKPGILLRGYKGSSANPLAVTATSNPYLVGDESILLARSTNCPVVVARKRALGAKKLSADNKIDVILADDGLQHYALKRDIEIAVIDMHYKFGNGHSIPRGPLREKIARLDTVDMSIVSGLDTNLKIKSIYNLSANNKTKPIDDFIGNKIHAIAGIGRPNKFFNMLQSLGIEVVEHPFPDHYIYKETDLDFTYKYPILMTEKDAVKCSHMQLDNCWVVSVEAELHQDIEHKFKELVKGVIDGR